jgi:hypothetical protein
MEEGATYKSGWSSFALDSLVDMRRSKRSGLVLSSHTAESDVVADGVLSNVDAVLEEALGTGLTGSRGAGGCNDRVGSGLDDVFSVEVEELLVLLPAVVLSVPFGVPVLLAVGLVVVLAARGGGEGKGSGDESEESGSGEMHLGCCLSSGSCWKVGSMSEEDVSC